MDVGDAFVATDFDGDELVLDGAVTVAIENDVPIAGMAQEMFLTNLLDNEATVDLAFSIGADEPGAFTLTQAMGSDGSQTTLDNNDPVFGLVDGVVTQMSSDAVLLEWHLNSGSSDPLLYPDGSWSAVLATASGSQSDFEDATVFTVIVNADGTYTVRLDNPLQLDGAAEPFVLNFAGTGVSGGFSNQLIFFDSTEPDDNTEGTTDGNPDGIPDGSTIMVVAVGYLEDGTIGSVNSSTPGMGISDANTIDTDDGNGTTQSEELRVFFGEPVDPDLIDGALNDGFSLATEGGNTNDAQFIEKPVDFIKITLDSLNGDGDTGVLGSKDEFAIIGVVIEGIGVEGLTNVIWFKVEGEGNGASTDEVLIITQGMTGDGSIGSGDGSLSNPYVVDMSFDGSGTWTGTAKVDGEFATLLFQADPTTDSSYRVVAAEGKLDSEGFDIDTTFTATATDGDGDSVSTEFDVNFVSGTVLTGSEFSDVLQGNGDNETIFGLGGDDILMGDGGNDTLDGGAGADQNFGETGNDIIVFDSLDTVIDGGAGEDTLLAEIGSGDAIDLTTFAGTLAGIEVIDLEGDGGANILTLAAADLLQSDTDTLTVFGDGGDTVNAGGGWTDAGSGMVNGVAVDIFTQTVGSLVTLNLDTDIGTVNIAIV